MNLEQLIDKLKKLQYIDPDFEVSASSTSVSPSGKLYLVAAGTLPPSQTSSLREYGLKKDHVQGAWFLDLGL